MSKSERPSSETLRALETAPNMYLVLSPALFILTASELYLQATETTRDKIVGKHIFEAFPDNPEVPDIDGVQNINASLQEVTKTKQPHQMRVLRYDVPDAQNPGKFIQRFWHPCHTPVLDDKGEIQYIIQLAVNVTEKVLTEQALLESLAKQQEIFEQVHELNHQLSAANSELEAARVKLQRLNDELEERIAERTKELAASERKYRSLIEENPIAMQVYRGDDLTFEINNESMLRFLGKTAEINGKTLFEGVPEIVGQPIVDAIYQVYKTGNPLEIKAEPVTLHHNGKEIHGYYDVSYRALSDDGKITGILGIAIDVTAQVNAHHALEDSETKLRVAIEAARLGSWRINPVTKHLIYNDTLARIFGYENNEPMTYAQALGQVTEEYRPFVFREIEKAIADGGDYDITYAQRRFNDNEVIWLRSIGKIGGKDNSEFSGFVMDVTELKKDEIRKNDFIGMVSHELKTPLTTLTALVQASGAKLKNNNDPFLAGAMEKANTQVKKMKVLINSFLNVSRMEAGKIHIDRQHFNMAELIKEAEEESVATVSSHQIIFAPVVETFVNADRDKIGQVINNFISNAVKYAPNGSTIQVACVKIGANTQVSVKDEGVGIKPEDQKMIFDRYYRVESKFTQTISGFGIGLYICSEIIQRHEGRIWLESEVGKGSTFYFSLPLT